MANVIKRYSLVDQVYTQLRKDIVSLQLPLGSKVNVNELQETLGVSCTPIREAVNRLQQEGLVTYENKVGARVLQLNEHDVEEIHQLAMTLHCAAIRLAIKNGDREAIVRELRQRLAEYRRAKTVEAEVTAVNCFLGTYYHNCGNRRLDDHMISLQGQQLLLRYIFATCAEKRAADEEVFEQMLSYTEAGNAEAVCDILEDYTQRAEPIEKAYLAQL